MKLNVMRCLIPIIFVDIKNLTNISTNKIKTGYIKIWSVTDIANKVWRVSDTAKINWLMKGVKKHRKTFDKVSVFLNGKSLKNCRNLERVV